jgi:hypothetical protein
VGFASGYFSYKVQISVKNNNPTFLKLAEISGFVRDEKLRKQIF